MPPPSSPLWPASVHHLALQSPDPDRLRRFPREHAWDAMRVGSGQNLCPHRTRPTHRRRTRTLVRRNSSRIRRGRLRPGGRVACPFRAAGNRSGPNRLSVLPARSVQDWSSRRGRTRIRRSGGHVAGRRHWKLVPGAGFEPARPKPADFKSAASTWFRHPGGLEFRGGIAPARMEAEVGIEPAYTALQAAA